MLKRYYIIYISLILIYKIKLSKSHEPIPLMAYKCTALKKRFFHGAFFFIESNVVHKTIYPNIARFPLFMFCLAVKVLILYIVRVCRMHSILLLERI